MLILVGLFVMVFSTNVLGQVQEGYTVFNNVPDYRVREAENGKYDAMIEVGNAYKYRHEYEKAIRIFKAAAEQNPDALIYLGISYSEAMLLVRKEDKAGRDAMFNLAKITLEKALSNNNKTANHYLGVLYFWYDDTTDKAGEYWLKSARNGNKLSLKCLQVIKNPSKEIEDFLIKSRYMR